MKEADFRLQDVIDYYGELKQSKERGIMNVTYLKSKYKLNNINPFLRKIGALNYTGKGTAARYEFYADSLQPINARKALNLMLKDQRERTDKSRIHITKPVDGNSRHDRVLKFLSDLHIVLGYTDNISIVDFITKHSISRNMGQSLYACNIIKNVGGNGAAARYEWIAGNPDDKMADIVMNKLSEVSRSTVTHKQKQPKIVEKSSASISIPRPKYMDVPLFFGLFKVRGYFNYE